MSVVKNSSLCIIDVDVEGDRKIGIIEVVCRCTWVCLSRRAREVALWYPTTWKESSISRFSLCRLKQTILISPDYIGQHRIAIRVCRSSSNASILVKSPLREVENEPRFVYFYVVSAGLLAIGYFGNVSLDGVWASSPLAILLCIISWRKN